MTLCADVLLVNRVGYIGGVERVILNTMDVLASQGIRSLLLCPPNGGLAEQARSRNHLVHGVDWPRAHWFRSPGDIARFLCGLAGIRAMVEDVARRSGVKLIHCHHPLTAAYSAGASRSLGIPLVLHLHEILPLTLPYRLLMTYARRHIAHAICVGKAAEELGAACGLPACRMSVIHNTVDDAFFTDMPERTLDGGGSHIGLFGTIEPRKGHHVLVEAAPAILAAHPQARFHLVGEAPPQTGGQYRDQLKARIAALGLGEHVVWHGFVRDVRPLMAGMTVVVQPSVAFETLPTAVIEALALGRRVVASRIGSVPEIVKDGETGLIVPIGDSAALEQAVRRALALQPDDPMPARARMDIRNRFSRDAYLRNLLAVYQNCNALPAQLGPSALPQEV